MNVTHTNLCICGPLHGKRYRAAPDKQDWFEIVESKEASLDLSNIKNEEFSESLKTIKYNRYVFISEEDSYNHYTFWVTGNLEPEQFKNKLLSLFLERKI